MEAIIFLVIKLIHQKLKRSSDHADSLVCIFVVVRIFSSSDSMALNPEVGARFFYAHFSDCDLLNLTFETLIFLSSLCFKQKLFLNTFLNYSSAELLLQ